MEGQLFKNLDNLIGRMRYLSSSDESCVKAMSQQLIMERPGIEGRLSYPLRELAKSYIEIVMAIPSLVSLLKSLLEKEDCKSEWRHEIVLALVYLVRSDDLIPDNTPGGYGFIDDYMVLRITISYMLCNANLTEWIVSSQSSDKNEYTKLKKEYEEWMLGSAEYVGYIALYLPAEQSDKWKRLVLDVSGTYNKCSAWAAINPESLERRTKQLIDDPQLPDPVLTHPVDDDALWSQWEFKQAEKRKEEMRKAEEERSIAAQKLRLADTLNSYMHDRLISPVKTVCLPGGGSVATDGHGVYITRKPGS